MVVCERDDDVMVVMPSAVGEGEAAAAFVAVEATASLVVEGRDGASSAAYAGLFREDMVTDETTVADSVPWRSVRRFVNGVGDVVVVDAAGADVIVVVGEGSQLEYAAQVLVVAIRLLSPPTAKAAPLPSATK